MDKKDKKQHDVVIEDAQAAAPESAQENEENSKLTNLVTFKKVVRGYNPAEVDDYINFLNSNLSNAQQVFDAQSSELKSHIAFVTRERDKLKEERVVMAEKVSAYEQKCAECKAALEETEALKAQNVQLQEQVRNLFSKLESCKNLLTENQQFKRIIAGIDSERKASEEQKNKMVAEIIELRESNTKQAYEFAEEKKELEMQFSNERLLRAQLLQVHTYHVQKSEELLNEVLKQFTQAKASLKELNSKK